MLDHISTLEELEVEALQIDSFLQITVGEDGNEAAQRGNDLNVFMARTGKMLADAKYHQDQKLSAALVWVEKEYRTMQPSLKKRFAESSCKKENYMVTWIERLNRTATHQQQFMITLISKAKAEMQMNGKF